MRVAGLLLSLVILDGWPGSAQGDPSAQSAPAFEAASIRPREHNQGTGYFQIQPSGRVVYTNMTLRMVIIEAYEIDITTQRFLLVGGSDDVLEARFDITATPPDNDERGPRQTRRMLQTLLADRFGLRMHTETRPAQVYALTLARNATLGPNLHRSDRDCIGFRTDRSKDSRAEPPRGADGEPRCTTSPLSSPKPGTVRLRELGTIERLVNHIQAYLDRPVVDETGLAGFFDWDVTFSRDPFREGDTPSIFVALQRELGLTLKSGTAPVEVFVIDSVGLPTPN